MDYKKFNEMYKGLAEEVKNLEENNGSSYESVPVDDSYEVKVVKLEFTESKKGDPMVTLWFKIIAGEYKGSNIFVNQVIAKPYSLHQMNELLRSLESGVEVVFEDFEQYSEMLADIYEKVDGKMEYVIDYDKDSKGYTHVTVVDVYDVE